MGYGAMARAAKKLLDQRACWYVAGGGALASLDALLAVRAALGDAVPLLFDV